MSVARSGIDLNDPALPVAGQGTLRSVRRSRRAKWRAAVLIGVHLVIAAHIAHFMASGRTLSPVEPSESMYTLELGYVNAGFVFFVVVLLSTLVFGRFFCGWGCHIVALQDFCGWLMKKAGIRPRPFRSRLLVWVPLIAGLYMFVWPTFKRLVLSSAPSFPGFSDHLMTDEFWVTFPGPLFAVLTFATCGFAAVYVLGAKGFCTYGCPYGGFFGVLDTFSPGSIVVNDDCEGCGHCSATCTSNVLVHDEVRKFGKVVDPGCMKCMDCVNVCPKHALRFAWAKPSFLIRRKPVKRAVRYDLSVAEELPLLGVFVTALLAFRGLYDGPPLLMSLGLAGITSFIALKAVHLWRRPTVRLQNLNLKLGGSIAGVGWAFAAVTVVWLAFTAHSAFVQGHRHVGRRSLDRTQAQRADVLDGTMRDRWYPAEHHAAAAASLRHFRAADRWGLVPVREVELGLAWAHLLHDEVEPAVTRIRTILARDPDNDPLRDDLFRVLLSRGRADEALAVRLEAFDRHPAPPAERIALATRLAQSGHSEAAIAAYESALAAGAEGIELRYNLGGLLRREGHFEDAILHLTEAERLAPQDPDVRVELGLALQASGRFDEAIERYREAITLAPDRPEATTHLPALIEAARNARPPR